MKQIQSLLTLGLAATLLAGCSSSVTDPKSSSSKTASVFVFTSDYKTGQLRWLTGDSLLPQDTLSFDQDTKVVASGSNLYVLEGMNSTISLINTSKLPGASAVVYQQALAQGTDPQDLAIVNASLAYVALDEANYLLRINPATGATIDSISIAAYEMDSTTSPNPIAFALYGDTLCVAMQRLNSSWSAAKPGLLLFVQASTGKILDTLQLKGYNPGALQISGSKLYVVNQGNIPYGLTGALPLDNTQGIDVVDLSKMTVTTLVTSKALNGAPMSLVLDKKNNLLYAGVFQSTTAEPVAIVNASTGSVVKTAIAGTEYVFGGLALDSATSKLYIGDRGTHSGLKVWENDSLHTFAQTGALPPYSIAVVP